MNLFRKKIIAFTMVFALLIVAGGFCYVSSASAATTSSNASISSSQSETASNHNSGSMADHHGSSKKNGVASCCVDSGAGHHVIDKSVSPTRDNIKFSTSAISIADTSSRIELTSKDGVNLLSMQSPPKGDPLSSVIKKE
jgi:zona occludens toxin (predicted ATPase)